MKCDGCFWNRAEAGCSNKMGNPQGECPARLPMEQDPSRLRIYVAGPYSPQSSNRHQAIQEVAHNVHRAIEAGVALLEKGHIPFIPHLSHYIHTDPSCRREYPWYQIDNTFLYHWAQAFCYIGPSSGADMELELALKLGLKIFKSIDEVPEANPW